MKYDAITLDTNIFIQSGLYFEGGIIDQLKQFKLGSAQFILSEIIFKELHKHTYTKAKETKDTFEKSIKNLKKNVLFSEKDYADLESSYNKILTPEVATQQRLESFVNKTGCTILPADETDMKDLIKRYFTPLPPFEAVGNKKNEFPDAIALISLEQWGQKNNKKILAISQDKGWIDYAAKSQWIDIESDLSIALQKFQKHTEKAEKATQDLLTRIGTGKSKEILEQFISRLDDAVSSMSIYAEYESSYSCEEEGTYLMYKDFELQADQENEYSFHIVRLGKEDIVISLDLLIKAEAHSEFTMTVWDSIDRESVPMGSQTAETEIEFDCSILITINGDITAKKPEIEIENIEIIDGIDSVDFGHIELDLGPEDYEE